MKRILFIAALLAATAAVQAAKQNTIGPPGGKQMHANEFVTVTPAQRKAMRDELTARWSVASQAKGKRQAEWSTKLARVINNADPSNLLNAMEMPTYETMLGALQGQPIDSDSMAKAIAARGKGFTKSLGSVIADTVFTPLPNGRCRVADSRVINLLTVPTVVREIDVEDTSSYSVQGGNGSTLGDGSTNCGIPSFATSVAISVTVLPVGQDGFFKIFENGKSFTEGNTLLFTGAVGASNDVIVRSCQSCAYELSIYSNVQTHYVVDVIGYFMPPQATALDCQNTTPVEAALAASGGKGNAFSPVCPAGYTQTATNCETNSWDSPILFSSNGTCSAQNNGSFPAVVRASRTCCRVPGR